MDERNRRTRVTLDLFERDNVLATNAQKSQQLREAFAPLEAHPLVRDLRQCGTILAFDVKLDDPARARTFSRRFFEHALQRELLLRPIGTTVYLMPPYILDDEEIALLAERTRATFEATLTEAR